MQIFVLILGTVLLSKAACALKCYQCYNSGSCTQTTTECPSSNQCGSFTLTSYAGGSSSNVKIKSCATAENCVNGSVNFGIVETVLTSRCCSSDLCNSQDAPDGSIPSPNGKKCFTCDRKVCTKTLNCNGNEDYCISTKVTAAGATVTLKGCASKVICSKTQSVQIAGVIGAEISCCQGDLCNRASSTTASILLSVAPLISLIWIS
uniref:UPAR/Ly6 domain-containing protein n=1 Tax=Amphilophus citrinellus TaxID=61819 RepID=A0A3Q0R1E3_AMPCI